MKKCNFCENDATENYVVKTKNGSAKFPACKEHSDQALEKCESVKRGSIKIIPIGPRQSAVNYDTINEIVYMCDAIKKACNGYMKKNVTTREETIETIDGPEIQEINEIDIKGTFMQSGIIEQIPKMITMGQYAHKLNELIDRLEK